jgi:hypothetical protein
VEVEFACDGAEQSIGFLPFGCTLNAQENELRPWAERSYTSSLPLTEDLDGTSILHGYCDR